MKSPRRRSRVRRFEMVLPVKSDCYDGKGVLQYTRAELEEMARTDPKLTEFHASSKGSKTRLKHANAAELCRKLGLMGEYVPSSESKPKKCAARATKKYDIYSKAELVERINAARRAIDPSTTDLLTVGKANKMAFDKLCEMMEGAKSNRSQREEGKKKKKKKSREGKKKSGEGKKRKKSGEERRKKKKSGEDRRKKKKSGEGRKKKKSERKSRKSARRGKKTIDELRRKKSKRTKLAYLDMTDEQIREQLQRLPTVDLLKRQQVEHRVIQLIEEELNRRAAVGMRSIRAYFPRASPQFLEIDTDSPQFLEIDTD